MQLNYGFHTGIMKSSRASLTGIFGMVDLLSSAELLSFTLGLAFELMGLALGFTGQFLGLSFCFLALDTQGLLCFVC